MINNLIKLIVFLSFGFGFSQSIQVGYVINKTNEKSNSTVNYNLSIEGNNSIFFPQNKCIMLLDEEESLIPTVASEVVVEKKTNIKIFDKIGKIKVYYPYTEKLNWKITSESKKENGYILKKATLSYNNREWIAWFIPDIPIPEGPYIFKKLPGLIYSVNDINNNYLFQMTSIDNKEIECFLGLESYKEITKEKYITTLEVSSKNDSKLLESLMGLDIPKDGFESLNKKIDESSILRGL